jgi:hypothetical protein
VATNVDERSIEAGFEEHDVSARKLFYFFVFIAVSLGLISGAVLWLFGGFAVSDRPAAAVPQTFQNVRELPPPPRVQADPEADIVRYKNSQQDTLDTYGWVNREQGIVRIPIERAMQLTVQRGLPVRTPETAPGGKRATGGTPARSNQISVEVQR